MPLAFAVQFLLLVHQGSPRRVIFFFLIIQEGIYPICLKQRKDYIGELKKKKKEVPEVYKNSYLPLKLEFILPILISVVTGFLRFRKENLKNQWPDVVLILK